MGIEEAALSLGSKIGKYTVRRVLGVGGMGAVYEAEQESPKRRVALKVIRDAHLADERARLRFEREVEALGRLHHPAIAQVLEAGTTRVGTDDVPWFAMELVEDPRTIERYAREAALGARGVAALFKIVCDAVHYAHQRGVIHRDLKPANIKIAPDGRAKVLDFGIAKTVAPGGVDATQTALGTQLGVVMGTPAYMSPEQARGETAGRQSDIWAFGVVLFEMLTGASPFAASRRARRPRPKRRKVIPCSSSGASSQVPSFNRSANSSRVTARRSSTFS